MKLILVFVCSVLISINCLSQKGKTVTEYYYKELKKSEGILNDNNKKEGTWHSWYADGSLRSVINYVDGLRNGESIFYYHGGSAFDLDTVKLKKDEAQYERVFTNQKDKLIGPLFCKQQNESDTIHGESILYERFHEGKITKITNYNHGKKHGLETDFNLVGEIISIKYFSFDKLDSTEEYLGKKKIATKYYEKKLIVEEVNSDPNLKSDEILTVVDENPQFPGGNEALAKFISENYAIDASIALPISGRVYVNFVVEMDGSLSDIKIMRGMTEEKLNQEALRVVKAMPKWIPGKNKGKIVRVSYSLPIVVKKQE